MNAYAQTADKYLVQRVMSASPEQQAALLMEAGQRFLGRAGRSMEQKDALEVARCLGRVADIVNEAVLRLNIDGGGELVKNLLKIYAWWTDELFEIGSTKDVARLNALSHHMGEIRMAWEQLHAKQMAAHPGSEFELGARVV